MLREHMVKRADDLCSGLNYYLAQFGISNVRDIVGAGLSSVSDTTDVLERDTVLFPRFDTEKCNFVWGR